MLKKLVDYEKNMCSMPITYTVEQKMDYILLRLLIDNVASLAKASSNKTYAKADTRNITVIK